jgi:hypothetical protein
MKLLWAPQEDITVYELALALNVLLPSLTGALDDADVDNIVGAMPDKVVRHFKRK